MTTTATKTGTGRTEVNEGQGAFLQNDAPALGSTKYHPMVSALMKRIKDEPGNPYWLAFEAMIELTGCNPWRWQPHWSKIVKEVAVRERQRRGELESGVEIREVSTRNAHSDRMLSVRVDGERDGTVLKDAEGWRVFGDPRTRYASRGNAVDTLVAGRRALQEIDEGAVT